MLLDKYEKVLKHWDRAWGAKPTNPHLRQIDEAELARAGSKTAFALAMLMRDGGASQGQIKAALGATYRNRPNQLEEAGRITLNERKTDGQTYYSLGIVPSEEPETDRQNVGADRQNQVEEQPNAA